MFGSKSVVDLLVRGGKIEIAVALNGDFAVNSVLSRGECATSTGR